MMRRFVGFLLCVALSVPQSAQARDWDIDLAAEAAVILPMGDWERGSGNGGGVFVRGEQLIKWIEPKSPESSFLKTRERKKRRTFVAVMELVDYTGTLDQSTLVNGAHFLRERHTSMQTFYVVEHIRQQVTHRDLISKKAENVDRQCWSRDCQIALGRELAADSILRTEYKKEDGFFRLVNEIIDLKTGITIRRATHDIEAATEPDETPTLTDGLQTLTLKMLGGKRSVAGVLLWSARIGFLQCSEKSPRDITTHSTHLPIMGGLKYTVGPRGFVTGELGLSWNTFYETVPNAGWTDHNEDSRVDLAMNLGFGYQWDRVDGRVNLLMPDLADIGEIYGFLLSLGYRFTTL